MTNFKSFIQIENASSKVVRYACSGKFDEFGRLTGIVYGSEGGGEYEAALIVDGKFIADGATVEDEFLDFEDEVSAFEKATKIGFYKECSEYLETRLDYNFDTSNYEVKDMSIIKDDVFSEMPVGVIPPDYGMTSWDNTISVVLH